MLLGELSSKYESNGDPGTVSNGLGDAGGVSYGAYQFASNVGIPQAFVEWLVQNGYQIGALLAQARAPGYAQFSKMWRRIAEQDSDGFFQLQHAYVKEQYFDRAVDLLAQIGFDVISRCEALQQVLWSRAVQYGPGNMVELFQSAAAIAGQELSTMNDRDLIYYIYEVNLTDPSWTAGSPSLRPGLFSRFEEERQDAINLLGVS